MAIIEQLYYLQGIAQEYTDYAGKHHQIADEIRRKILTVCGHNITDDEASAQTHFQLDAKPWLELLPANMSTQAASPTLAIRLSPEQLEKTIKWQIFNSNQLILSGNLQGDELPERGNYNYEGVRYTERTWKTSSLDPGYYRFVVSIDSHSAESFLIVAPDKAYNPINQQRIWGISTQLYGIRSDQNYGIGDFADLAQLVDIAAHAGADFIMLNPLHTLFEQEPERASPYSPSDRFLLNSIYIHPDWCDDFSNNKAATTLRDSALFTQQLASITNSDWVDYSAVFKLKFRLYVLMFNYFFEQEWQKKTSRAEAFQRFHQKQSKLVSYTGQLANYLLEANSHANQHPELFNNYLQWLAEQQLSHIQQHASKQGMLIGLVRDLAVGCAADGSEVKRHSNLFVKDASIGAPPDPLGPLGQNWGLPPIDPVKLKADNYNHFIQLIRANMQSCGALRVDHVMGLLRLWWCLLNENSHDGCYVYYPFETLFEILKLESVLNKCLIIGEDLGIVPEPVKIAMAEAEAYSNLLFYFEKNEHGHFRPISQLNNQALLMIANHDVPPFAHWWHGDDLALRSELKLFETEHHYHDALNQRKNDKRNLYQWLSENNPDLAQQDITTQTAQQIYRLLSLTLAGSQVRLLSLQLDDFDNNVAPVNIPGTDKEYPNWRRRLSKPIQELLADKVFFSALQEKRNKERT
jgi:4-alpha-glucanotransferase